MSDCPRAGKWIGGCKFRPRYDEVTASDMAAFWTISTEAPRPSRKTYITDVCETCGKMIDRCVNVNVGAKP